MKRLLLSACLFMSICLLLAGLPPQLTRGGNPVLYQELQQKATQNIQRLPLSSRRDYSRLLSANPNVLMAFLIAYESDANLAFARPADLLSNYQEIVALLEKEGLQYSPEFFLSYIAKQTVSDEAITPYREALLEDGLLEILDNYPDLLERYRQVSLWCVERLRFQPTSGRDQSPIDITQKSLLGRCEEMQILFVAAARTVGIPARPASTPWWAHTDNNHAWAEFFYDGRWNYTGDMDSAYFPNQTWFSGMIDKTILILADGSLPDSSDEIISRGRYECTINSTRNYAGDRSRKLRLRVLDSSGQPAEEASIGVMVYNWGSLRPLTWLKADSLGQRELTVGRGSFFLMTNHEGEMALTPVLSTIQSIDLDIHLHSGILPDLELILQYPANPMNWQSSPESWNAAADSAKAIISSRLEGFKTRSVPGFGATPDNLYEDVARLCHLNYEAFESFARRNWPLQEGFLILLRDGDPKLLWQADEDLFAALYGFYKRHTETFESLSPEDAQELFSPSVYFEDLHRPFPNPLGKPTLYPRYFVRPGADDAATAHRVISYLNSRYKIDASKSLSGLIPLHIAYRQNYLSSYQFRIMAVSAMRANGIPAQFSRIPDLIMILVDGDWQYYNVASNAFQDPSNEQETDKTSLVLTLVDEKGFPLHLTDQQIQYSIVSSDQLYSLGQSPEYLGEGKYLLEVPAEGIYLQIGYRKSDTFTGYLLRHFVPNMPESELRQTLHLYPRAWEEAEESILALLEGIDSTGYDVILIGNYNHENSLRVVDKLHGLDRDFLWLGYDASNSTGEDYIVAPAWQSKVLADRSQALRTITLYRDDDGWQAYEGPWEKLPE